MFYYISTRSQIDAPGFKQHPTEKESFFFYSQSERHSSFIYIGILLIALSLCILHELYYESSFPSSLPLFSVISIMLLAKPALCNSQQCMME